MNRILILLAILSMFVACACNSAVLARGEDPAGGRDRLGSISGSIFYVDPDRIDSLEIIYKADGSRSYMTASDRERLLIWLQASQYDSWRNDSGIMLKMAPQDYTLRIVYKAVLAREDDWITIWRTGHHAKILGKWYVLAANRADEIYYLLDSYAVEQNTDWSEI